MNTIIGVFDDAAQARMAMEALRDSALPLDDVSIVSRNSDGTAKGDSEDVSAGEGAAVGAVWGGLVGLASLLIPGVGPFIAGGALFAALTGAVTGAVVGGIAAALIDFSGIPEEEARGYEEQVRSGKTLVAVRSRDEDSAEVRRLLASAGADVRDNQGIATTAVAGRPTIAMYDESGQRVSDNMEREYGATSTATYRRGIYDIPGDGGATSGKTWTRGEVVGEGQGQGRRTDTGTYDADQWAGEGQRPAETPGDTWTSGEVVGEGQGQGRRTDTGTYDSEQWVGEGQGDKPRTDDTTKRTS
jgi:uncharacterized membrane protein